MGFLKLAAVENKNDRINSYPVFDHVELKLTDPYLEFAFELYQNDLDIKWNIIKSFMELVVVADMCLISLST